MASQSRIAARVCSVISNWTGLPVFCWITGTASHAAPDADVAHPEAHEVAAPQLTVDGEIEQSKVAPALFKLEADADRPDLLWLQRAFLANDAALIPWSFREAKRWDRGVHVCLLDPDRARRSADHLLTRNAIIYRRQLRSDKADLGSLPM